MNWFRKVVRRELTASQQMDANIAAGRDPWFGICNHSSAPSLPPDSSRSREYAAFVAHNFGFLDLPRVPAEPVDAPRFILKPPGERAA